MVATRRKRNRKSGGSPSPKSPTVSIRDLTKRNRKPQVVSIRDLTKRRTSPIVSIRDLRKRTKKQPQS